MLHTTDSPRICDPCQGDVEPPAANPADDAAGDADSPWTAYNSHEFLDDVPGWLKELYLADVRRRNAQSVERTRMVMQQRHAANEVRSKSLYRMRDADFRSP